MHLGVGPLPCFPANPFSGAQTDPRVEDPSLSPAESFGAFAQSLGSFRATFREGSKGFREKVLGLLGIPGLIYPPRVCSPRTFNAWHGCLAKGSLVMNSDASFLLAEDTWRVPARNSCLKNPEGPVGNPSGFLPPGFYLT